MPLPEQYLEKFLEALKNRGVPAVEIDSFERHWGRLPPHTLPPCPFCYVSNRRGDMEKRTEVAGLAVLACGICDVSVVVRE